MGAGEMGEQGREVIEDWGALLYSTVLMRVHASCRRGAGKERGKDEEADHQGDASVTVTRSGTKSASAE